MALGWTRTETTTAGTGEFCAADNGPTTSEIVSGVKKTAGLTWNHNISRELKAVLRNALAIVVIVLSINYTKTKTARRIVTKTF